MRPSLVFGTLLICVPLVWAQDSSFPDLSGFTRSPTEHIINQVDEPFRVRSVTGMIETAADGNTPGRAGILLEIEGPQQERTIRHAITDSHGYFKISHVPHGTYRFKATLDGFQSVVGTIVVSKDAAKSAHIKIQMPLGV